MSSLTDLSISQLVLGYQAKDFSPIEVTKAYFDRIEKYNENLNAFVYIDREGGLASAKLAEDKYNKGDFKPLLGVPLAHKDLYCTKGLPSTAGSKVLENNIPDVDATSVERLSQSGAINLGKLNTHEFAYGPTNENSLFGSCLNPWNYKCFSGGSSGGSGSAVAARLCAGATGSDTGGSIRIPSACCGISGLKPTYGRVSRAGIYPLCWTMDHSGPMARSVEDLALMLKAMSGVDKFDSASSSLEVGNYAETLRADISGIVLGIPNRYFFDQAQPDIENSVREAIEVLKSLGATVIDIDIEHIEHAAGAALAIYLSEGTAYHDNGFENNQDLYSDQVRGFLELGNFVLAKDYINAQRFRTLLGEEMARLFEQVDYFITPGLALTAQQVGQENINIRGIEQSVFSAILRNTEPFNLTGVPALVVPCGFSSEGLPHSMQIIGRPFDEAGILNIGHIFQSVTSWHIKLPSEVNE
tara:strand:- start:5903 stop:7315 length:1413 start_codon:yes stop_codon:yes gene_type:complete